MHGYNGKILRVNLTQQITTIEEPGELFYRQYIGGRGFISYFLLKELEPDIDPLGSDNKLIFATGPVTGAPISGAGRNSVGAKSPVTGGYGEAEVGGFWGAELKRAGFDAIIIEGKAEKPVYLWINDGSVEIRDAGRLWGKSTAEAYAGIQHELKDTLIRIALIGPAGENLVRFACILNDLRHAAGRTGLGAVMGSKNLKAVAVRGHGKITHADPEAVSRLAKGIRDNIKTNRKTEALNANGTAGALMAFNAMGGLPTRNFQDSHFEGAKMISGELINRTILTGHRSCFACAVRCKPEVTVGEPYNVDGTYGGPEYETLSALGSNCGVDDIGAVAKANELCSAYGIDTISAGITVAFAMECFEKGILTAADTGGMDLKFGNAGAMVKLVEMIGRREGLGNLLAEGTTIAAREIGNGAEEYSMQVKGQGLPMHEPRLKPGMAVGLLISPTGADHCHNIGDNMYTRRISDELSELGILEPVPLQDLGPAKMRILVYGTLWQSVLNCLVYCQFIPMQTKQTADLVRAVTGWNTNVWELVKAGERAINLARIFNIREGQGNEKLPERFYKALLSGPIKGYSLEKEQVERAVKIYYGMMGWDEAGKPAEGKLQELGIEWANWSLTRQCCKMGWILH